MDQQTDKAKTYALVTGGSSGIGLAFAKALANKGYNLVLVSENGSALSKAKAEINNAFRIQVETFTLDLSKQEASANLLELLNSYINHIEVLVNNAGMYFFGHATDVEPAQSDQLINLHILTVTRLSMYFGKLFKTRGHGYILNVSSMSAVKNFPGIAHYASSKAYLRAFTRSLHIELKPYGVHTTCLLPGAVDTNLYDTSTMNVNLGKRLGIILSPEQVARTGLNGLWRNKAEVIPGLVTKVIIALMRLTPYWLIYQIRKRSDYLD